MKTQIHITLTALLLAGSLGAATTVHELGGGLSAISEDAFFGEGSAADVGTDIVFTITGANVGGETFDYTLTIGVGIGVADLTIAGNNMGQTGATNNRFDHGDQIVLTVSGISNSNVQFDGLLGFGLNYGGTAIGYDIAGTEYIQGGALDPRFGAAPGALITGASTTITYLNNRTNAALSGNIRGIALQFSNIPEPSASALLAMCALGFIAKRRRR